MKRKIRWIVLALVGSVLLVIFVPKVVWQMGGFAFWSIFIDGAHTRTAKEAEKHWGRKPFDSKMFRNGTDEERSSMASDIAEKKIGLELSLRELKQLLGEPDGGYYNDGYWNYRLTRHMSSDGQLKEAWSLVFCFKYPEEKVREVFIWRECCDNIPRWMMK